MASGVRVPIAVVLAALLASMPSEMSAGRQDSVYLDVLSSWGKAADGRHSECGLKVHGELLGVFAKRQLSVIDPGRGAVAVSLEARAADVWTSQTSGTTTYVGLLVRRGKATGVHVYYPAAPNAPPKRANVQSTEELRAVARGLAAAYKAQESARLARLMATRLTSLPGTYKTVTTAMSGDFLLDNTPGPAVVLELVVEGDSTGCPALPSGVASAITDAVGEFLQMPRP